MRTRETESAASRSYEEIKSTKGHEGNDVRHCRTRNIVEFKVSTRKTREFSRARMKFASVIVLREIGLVLAARFHQKVISLWFSVADPGLRLQRRTVSQHERSAA